MPPFHYADGRLHCEEVPLEAIAREVGTPCYVYSHAALAAAYDAFDRAFGDHPHLICYACKANGNLAVIRTLAARGAGADIVSGGELYRAQAAGVPGARIVFSGVGKSDEELAMALAAGILCFNVESEAELDALEAVAARLGRRAPVAIRVNPDVDPGSHPYVATGLAESKFGIPIERAIGVYRRALAQPHLDVVGLDCHIGSELTDLAPLADALGKLRRLAIELRGLGVRLHHVDVGGGLAIAYREEERVPTPEAYARVVLGALGDLGLPIVLEPGRALVGPAGVLLTRVLYTKSGGARPGAPPKRFVIVDAAMTDLIRPSLYRAYHPIWPVRQPDRSAGPPLPVDVVGPVCESADFLARDRALPPLERGALLAVMQAGAYGFAMASTYNARPRAAEVLVRGGAFAVVRQRERYEDLVRGETIPPFLEG
ncbi:MAG TPA: diaminopimelate decarboxylase [Thermodesulfobacteriota bacterium]|nr:diaminopimelate decarboxylase [Thermodesulfobacteriota bacterium]